MRSFLYLIVTCIVSLLGYFVIFGFLVSRPLVLDQIETLMTPKLAYAAAMPHPRIFIIAGSNARYSHSCAVLEQMLHRPCINLGITEDVSPDWMFDHALPELAKGDLVYLPLEYDLYHRTRVESMIGVDAAYRFRHDKASLLLRGPEGMVRAAFMFSLPTLIQSAGEMTLDKTGFHRRVGADTMDRQGDEVGHDGQNALPYREIIANTPRRYPEPDKFGTRPDGTQAMIVGFLEWCRAHGVVVVGGLPTIFNDVPVPPRAAAQLKDFYARHGAAFVVLDNFSQYPRTDFYDTGYHLRQSAQIAHSRLLAEKLRPLLPH